jgi:MerR family redox-sensitive transcriptional activator SoxR
MSIGEMARRSGVPATALRYYEKAGVLPAPLRVSGRRAYAADALQRVRMLRFAQQAGFSLEEIKTLLGGASPLSARWQALAKSKLTELDRLAAKIGEMKRALSIALECGCAKVEDCTLSPEHLASAKPASGSCCR